MAIPVRQSVTLEQPAHEIEDTRRARELYTYLQPDNLVQHHLRRRGSTFDTHHEHVPSLSAALAPFCELTVLRCDVTKAMLNVMDRDVMYFLAESSRRKWSEGGEKTYEFVEDPIFLSCSSVPVKGRICEMTIRGGGTAKNEESLSYVIPDLTKSQFAHMDIITGPPYYRFYAGVPITTREGVNIGSLAIMDTEKRLGGLTLQEEKFLTQMARQIMTYLETNRQAIEGRRSRQMAKGLEAFISGKNSIEDPCDDDALADREPAKILPTYGVPLTQQSNKQEYEHVGQSQNNMHTTRNHSIASIDSYVSTSDFSTEPEETKEKAAAKSDPDSHIQLFARAANLLRESMGDLGGEGVVCFQSLKPRFGGVQGKPSIPQRMKPTIPENAPLGISVNHTPEQTIRKSPSQTKMIAFSTHANPLGIGTHSSRICSTLSEIALQDLTVRYPNGHLWTLEEVSYSSSEEENVDVSSGPISTRVREPSKRKLSEIKTLKAAFPAARQILFAPLWDAAIGSSAHGVFVSTALEMRSFNATSEISFLNAFCSTLMAECSRLDTMMADKQKSDFVGTISHEMRSPLHGVLASVEFLAETDMTGFQQSLIETIDSCGRTLLDTINHVLDFSKVNSFQKQWQAANKRSTAKEQHKNHLNAESTAKSLSNAAPPLLQLTAVINISVVLEEVVDGLVLGHTYTSGIDITDTSHEASGRIESSRVSALGSHPANPVDILLDIEQADWNFMTQPGAVRRIIMNVTGNAIKYTSSGNINIRLRMKTTQDDGQTAFAMVFTVTDTGKGISPEFLATRLFVPFAQENALAPGTGLGMSIVKSIVLMLGGTIDVKSTVGRGTVVQVELPLNRPLPGQQTAQSTPGTEPASVSAGPSLTESLSLLKTQAAEATITFWRNNSNVNTERTKLVETYVHDWYSLQFVDPRLAESASLVIVEEEDLEALIEKAVSTPGRRPAIVVLCSVLSRHNTALIESFKKRVSSAVEFVANPFGPYKLARSMRSALEANKALNHSDPATQNRRDDKLPPAAHRSVATFNRADQVANRLHELGIDDPAPMDSSSGAQAASYSTAQHGNQHIRSSISDPSRVAEVPQAQTSTSEGSAFPFPVQTDETSRQRRQTSRYNSQSGINAQDYTSTDESPKSVPVMSRGTALNVAGINPHILLVDDNKINLKLLETFLRSKRKYTRIAKAEDGQQAVDTFTTSTVPFDIIFMDISMPVLNGFEATRAIRVLEDQENMKPGAMIIALTGLASGRDQSEGFDSGCDIYMTKPVSFKEVGKLLNSWEHHQKQGLLTQTSR